MREKYRRAEARWDSHSGNFIPIRILCNTWWKWMVYLRTTAMTFLVTGYAYSKTGNLYPLLSSMALPAMSIFLGAGLPLGRRIEDIQADCRGSCQEDVILVPIIGHGLSTSIIVITYHKLKRVFTIERRQSIIAHTNYSGDNYEIIKSSFRKRFTGISSEIDEFINDAKNVINLVTSIGGWFRLSLACLDDRDRLRQLLNSGQVYTGCNTAMYCWTRAIVESAIRVACSKLKVQYDRPENHCFETAEELFSFVAGEHIRETKIFDKRGREFDKADLKRMLVVAKDTRGVLAMAALLLDRMSFSGDNRVPQLMTLAHGYDIKVIARRGEVEDRKEYSKDIVLDKTDLHGPLGSVSASERIKALATEPYALANTVLHEIISAEFVPMNWTSFCVHRQHMLMYLLFYMGISVVLVVFGQTQQNS